MLRKWSLISWEGEQELVPVGNQFQIKHQLNRLLAHLSNIQAFYVHCLYAVQTQW